MVFKGSGFYRTDSRSRDRVGELRHLLERIVVGQGELLDALVHSGSRVLLERQRLQGRRLTAAAGVRSAVHS